MGGVSQMPSLSFNCTSDLTKSVTTNSIPCFHNRISLQSATLLSQGFRAVDEHHGHLSSHHYRSQGYAKLFDSHDSAPRTARCCHYTNRKADHQGTRRAFVTRRIYGDSLWCNRLSGSIYCESACAARMYGGGTISGGNGEATSQSDG
jgi:hypothetical protein